MTLKMMKWASVALVTLAVQGISRSDDTQIGRLTIYVSSTLGSPLPAGRLSISADSRKVLSISGMLAERTVTLPFGEYQVTFETEFLKPVRRSVTVDSLETFLVLATNMADTVLDVESKPVGISLKIQPNTSCRPGGFLWARLVGVFSDYISERKIEPFGFALFEPLEVGQYVVIVVDGKTVRAIKPVDTSGPVTVVNLELPPCPTVRK